MYRLEQDEHAVWHIRGGRHGERECVGCIEADGYAILRELLRAEFIRELGSRWEAEVVMIGGRGGTDPG